jgi:hypothetical protein
MKNLYFVLLISLFGFVGQEVHGQVFELTDGAPPCVFSKVQFTKNGTTAGPPVRNRFFAPVFGGGFWIVFQNGRWEITDNAMTGTFYYSTNTTDPDPPTNTTDWRVGAQGALFGCGNENDPVPGNFSLTTVDICNPDTGAPQALCQNNFSIALPTSGTLNLTTSQINNGSIDPGNCDPNPDLAISPSSFTCNQLGPQLVTLTVTDDAGNQASCTTTVTVLDNPPTADAGGPYAVCSDNPTVNLNGSIGGVNNGSVWTGGNGTFNPDRNTLNATYTPTAAEITAGSLMLTLSTVDVDNGGPCTTASESVTITISPAPTASGATAADVCGQNSVSLEVTTNTNGMWTVVTGNGSITNPTMAIGATYNPDVNDFGTQVTVRWTTNATAPCTAVTSDATFNVFEPATAEAGPNQTICEGGSATLNNSSIGGGATEGTWSITSGPNTNINQITNPGPQADPSAAVFTPTAAGTYVLTLTTDDPDAGGLCTVATDNVTITVNQAATAEAGPNQTICDGGSANLLGSSIGGGATEGTWSITSGPNTNVNQITNPGPQADPSAAVFTPSAAGTYVLTLTTDDPDAGGPCTAASDNVTITVNQAATAEAGPNQTICEGGSATLNNSSIGGGATEGTWSITSGPNTNINQITNPGPQADPSAAVFTPTAAGTYVLTLTTDDPDAGGPCAAASDNVTITVNQAATAEAGPNQTICDGGSANLLGSSIGGGATEGTWSITSGPNTNVNQITNPGPDADPSDAVFTPTAAGTYVLTLSTDDPTGPCIIVTDNVTITVNQAATASNAAGTDVCGLDASTLSVTTNTTGSWSVVTGGGNISNATSANSATYIPVVGDQGGTVTVRWTTDDPDGNGPCPIATADATFNVNAPATASNATAGDICGIFEDSPLSVTTNSTGQWTIVTADAQGAILNGTSANDASYKPSFQDIGKTITVRWTTDDPDGNGPCPVATADASFNVNTPATAENAAGTDVCGLDASNLSVTTNNAGTWTVVTGGGTISNPGSANGATYNPVAGDQGGTVTVRWTTDDPDGNGPCPIATADATFNVNTPATASNATAGDICGIFEDSPLSVTTNSTGQWTIVTADAQGAILNGTSANDASYKPSFQDIGKTITVRWTTDDPDGNGPCPVATADASFNVNTPATAENAAGTDVCGLDASDLSVTTNNAGTWTVVTGGGTISNANDANGATYNPVGTDQGNMITVRWTTIDPDGPNGPCPAVSADATFGVFPPVIVEAGPDLETCSGIPVTLSGSFIGGGASEGTWTITSQPAGGDGQLTNAGPDADPSDATFSANVVGDYVLTLTTDDPQGPCPLEADQVTISVGAGVQVFAPEVNVTIPSCQDDVQVFATFTIIDCRGPNINDIVVEGFGQFAGITPVLYPETAGGPDQQSYAIGTAASSSLTVGPTTGSEDFFLITYDDVTANLIFNVVQGRDIDVAIIAPEVNASIPSCLETTNVLASFTIYDCAGAPDFGDFNLTGFGQFAGQVFSNVRDLAEGPNQRTFYISNNGTEFLAVGPTDGGGLDRITISYKGTEAELRVNVQAGSDIDRLVTAPDINLTIPSCFDRMPFLAEFTVADCEGAPDFGDFTVTGFGQFAGRTFAANVRNVAQGPNQQEYYITEGPGVPGAILTAVPSANPFADGFVVEYKDIVTVIRVNAVADPDIDQAVIVPEATLTIPACEDDITTVLDFTLLDCQGSGAPTVTGFGQFAGRTFSALISSGSATQATWGIFEAGNPNGVTMRPTTNGPGGDGFVISFKGINTPYFVTVIEGQEKLVGPVIDEPGQNRWFIPECETCTEVNAFFTGIDNCDGAVTPLATRVRVAGGADLVEGTDWIQVVEDNGERHVRILCADPGDYQIYTEATDSDRNTTRNVFFLEIESLGEPDLDNLSCNDNVFVQLDNNCEKAILADMVLEGFVCNDQFTVVIDYGDGNKERDNISQCGTFKYEVFILLDADRMGELVCWGYITAEDKTPAVVPTKVYVPVACGDLDIILANSERDKVRKLGTGDECVFPMFGNAGFYTSWDLIRDKAYFNINKDVFDACSDYCDLKFQINDLKMEGDICAEDPGDRPMVVRTVKVTDEKGNSAAFEIWFYENQPQFRPGCKDEVDAADGHKGFYLYEDISCYMNTEIDLCLGDHAVKGSFYYYSCWYDVVDGKLVQREVRPSFTATDNGGTASFCGYAATYVDVKIPIEDDCGYKITRSWTLLDWCVEEPFRKVWEKDQLIKKGYFSPLEVTIPAIGNKDGYVTTGAFDCTASWEFGAPGVTACDAGAGLDFSIKIYSKVPVLDKFGIPTGEYEWVLANVPLRRTTSGWIASGLPVGKHKVIYDVGTNCQQGAAEAEFEVKDLTAPVAICDDELNISVGGSGIARVTVQDVDEGSWDNCQLESLELRRKLDDCLDAYLSEVLGVSSLDDLQSEEFTNAHGEKGTRWFRYMDTQKMILISQEPGQDGGTLHYYSWWAQEVYFTCCDIATSLDDFVVLELKAVDKAGNKNICWMDVMVESKQVATCWAPADIAIACTDLNFDPADYDQVVAALGAAADLVTVDFNCAAVLSDTISWAPADCSEGVLTRIFTVTTTTSKGVVERTCEQKIEIYNINDYLIKFPADASDVCEGDGGDDLELTTYACDVFAVNRDTAIFDASGDACFKRYVTYRVINWCEYDGVSLEPTIVPRDVDCDGNLEEMTWVRVEGEPKWNADTPTNTVWIDDDANPKNEPVITFPRTANSYRSLACDGNKEYWITPGYWEYTQVVKVYDDEAPELTVTTDDLSFCANGATGAADCNGEVMILFEVEDLCTGTNVEVRSVLLSPFNSGPADLTGELYNVEGENGSYMITSLPGVGLPVGSHTFFVRVADDCGNITNRLIEFSVEDCKSPAPICIRELSVDLMPVVENKVVVGGMNEVWATDFIASDIFDCTPHPDADGAGDVKYYVIKGDVPGTLDSIALEENRVVTFTCDDQPVVPVFVFAVDGAGNWDYCTILVNVIPGTDPSPCESINVPSALIQGAITTEANEGVEQVSVNLSGQTFRTVETGTDGLYAFEGLEAGYDYSVTPSRDDNPMNGVSTFDLVLISKHILGIQNFDSPYKLLAADVNNSGSVTTLDIIQVRKLILSIDTEFSNSASWVFVRKDYVFPDPSNPWAEQTPSIINLNNLEDDMLTGDFFAIKRGDVNGSAIANSRMGEPRNIAGTLQIQTQEVAMKAGNEYTLSFTADQLAQIQGYQYTLNFDNTVLELVDINYGVAGEDNFGLTHLEDGVITNSWNGQADNGAELFQMVVRAKSDAMLSELMSITSRYTTAEAYSAAGEQLDVTLSFGDDAVVNAGFELYQNSPNPFVSGTQIGFNLPEASEVTLTINDVSGRTLKVIRGEFAKGYNIVNVNDLPSGVMYYTLKSGDFMATKKMIKIE